MSFVILRERLRVVADTAQAHADRLERQLEELIRRRRAKGGLEPGEFPEIPPFLPSRPITAVPPWAIPVDFNPTGRGRGGAARNDNNPGFDTGGYG